MLEAKLDQVVKGAPPPDSKSPSSSRTPSPAPSIAVSDHTDDLFQHDPTMILPSSPPQIYLNLLILEASLRSQYLTLRARRRQHTFFLLLLTLWITYFSYALFLRPREDGRGVGGSVYWVVEMAEKVALMGGVVTAILAWGTGQWERGMRWPRRWVGVANRGLRSINTKLVVIKGPWWRELISTLAFLLPYPSLFSFSSSSYNLSDHLNDGGITRERDGHGRQVSRGAVHHTGTPLYEEDLTSGGDHVKLLLLPKPFSPDFRENWELYRTEYWEKENERRALLRRKAKKQKNDIARKQGGWLWWTGWRGWKRFRQFGKGDGEGNFHHHHNHRHSEKELRHRTKGPSRSESYSRSSSRSTTPTRETDDRPTAERLRRMSSNAGSSSGQPRKTRPGSSGSDTRGSQLLSAHTPSSSDSYSDIRPRLLRARSSRSGSSGMESDGSSAALDSDGRAALVKQARSTKQALALS